MQGRGHRAEFSADIDGIGHHKQADQRVKQGCRVVAPHVASRAVQRSIYDTHSEDGTCRQGDAMASVCDIVNAIEAQDVGGERAQACKDAGIASDAAGVSAKLPSRM